MVKQILPKAGEAILALFNKLGGNMNNVLGSRSNITFLGKGKNTEAFLDSDINVEAIGVLGKNKILEELESSIGYLTAGKLNDVQANKLLQNMQRIDEVFNPKQVANITDLGTGTRNLDAEGIASLRTTQELEKNKPIFDKAMQSAAKESEAMRNAGLDPSNLDDYKKAQEMGIIRPSGDYMTDEGVMASETILPIGKTDKTMNIKDVVTKQGKGDMDFIDFVKAQGDEAGAAKLQKEVDRLNEASDAADARLAIANMPNAPIKRANAREFLVEALKRDTMDINSPGFGRTNLNDFISGEDVKFITEGGGGIMGDPLILVEKYFGPRILELIPDERMTPKFINRLLTNIRDATGKSPDDPGFDRFTATLIGEEIPFAKGGLAKILEV